MKSGDLVLIAPRPFLGRVWRIGMILDWYDDDPVELFPAKVLVSQNAMADGAIGPITYVGKEYIKKLKNATHVSKTKN